MIELKIDTNEKWLPVYEALASNVRLKIIKLLSQKSMNIKEIAEELELSSAIVTMHIKKLEDGRIIKSERTKSKGGVQKVCTLAIEKLEIDFPILRQNELNYYEFSIPVGQYTDFDVHPTCGLASKDKVIGYFDDPRYFLDPERVNAKILWFGKGYIEYKIPNYILSSQLPEELQISMEICSEAPGYNNSWPSDISFFLNNVKIGDWTSPGDFGDVKGKYTPAWWNAGLNQYGVLKIISVNSNGTYIDGNKVSDVTINEINIREKQIVFRIAVLEDAVHVGGATILGSGFGNYDQDIIFRLYYK